MQQQAFTFGDGGRNQAAARGEEKAAPKIFTVSEVVGLAKGLLEKEFTDVWVVGEVSGFMRHSSGHCYFSLKDSSSILPVAFFKAFASRVKFKIEDGLELICHGNFSLYQKRGSYQLIADYLEPKGVGELQLAFEQLKKKLLDEGLFDKAHKKPIPFLPGKIGVVTSPTGAAIRDILKILKRRFSNVEVLLVPARVQGDGSAEEIAAAIELLNTRDDIDVMIVGRGGGSLEDLWAFNEEIVARAIYNSRIPVISAVGHEVDFTIADFVADFRAPTPSAAAEHAVPVKQELAQYLEKVRRQCVYELRRNLKNRMDKVYDLMGHLSPPTRHFPEYYRYVDDLKERMTYSLQVVVNKKEKELESLMAELNHLSPLAVLGKGYSLTTIKGDNKAVRASGLLKPGDIINVRFEKGAVEGKVTKIVD